MQTLGDFQRIESLHHTVEGLDRFRPSAVSSLHADQKPMGRPVVTYIDATRVRHFGARAEDWALGATSPNVFRASTKTNALYLAWAVVGSVAPSIPATTVPSAGTWLEAVEARSAEAADASSWVHVLRDLLERDKIKLAREMLRKVPQTVAASPQFLALRRVLALPEVIGRRPRGADRSREFDWLKKHAEEYRGRWVAVEGDDLILAADSLKDLLDALGSMKVSSRPLIHRLPARANAET